MLPQRTPGDTPLRPYFVSPRIVTELEGRHLVLLSYTDDGSIIDRGMIEKKCLEFSWPDLDAFYLDHFLAQDVS